jgi:hypothetical protein
VNEVLVVVGMRGEGEVSLTATDGNWDRGIVDSLACREDGWWASAGILISRAGLGSGVTSGCLG